MGLKVSVDKELKMGGVDVVLATIAYYISPN